MVQLNLLCIPMIVGLMTQRNIMLLFCTKHHYLSLYRETTVTILDEWNVMEHFMFNNVAMYIPYIYCLKCDIVIYSAPSAACSVKCHVLVLYGDTSNGVG